MKIRILGENFNGLSIQDGSVEIDIERVHGTVGVELSNGDHYWVQEAPTGFLEVGGDVAFRNKVVRFLQGGNVMSIKQESTNG